ncbi:MAG: FixH family protein [Alphaproteobacteria bacterium]
MSDIAEPRKSEWIPWFFAGAMAFVVAVNMLLVYFALSSWTGIETEGHYGKGIDYNQNLAATEKQKALGWDVRLSIQPDAGTKAPGFFNVEVRYADSLGKPLPGLRVRAHLIRPTHEGYDRQVELKASAPGQYQARLDVPLPGQWDLRLVAADVDGNFHQRVERIKVP